MPNLEKRKEQEISDPIELRDALVEAGLVGSLVKEKLNRDEMIEFIKAFTTAKQAKAKGGNISGQMEMFEDGGLKDEGNTVDPISGNDVPPGSTQEEVRDDIPAQLSEGEFVFPADVVRYIGLEKLMQMRQEAKQGLKAMEDMGQMGNSDEATMPDDLPFDMTDLDIDEDEEYNSDEKEMAEGGVIHAATGFAGTTTATQQLGSRASNFGNTATRTQPTKKYTPPPIPTATPTGGFKYGSQQAGKKGKLSFDQLFKEAGAADEYRTYVNDAGAEIQVPFKNGKVMTGFTVPEGYKPKTEKVDTAKTQTTKTKTARVEQESGDSDPRDSQTVVSLGGSIGPDGRVTGAKSFAFSVNPPKGMGINVMTMGKMIAGGITGNYPEGTTFNFQTLDKNGRPVGGIVKNVPASVYQNAKTITDRKGVKRTSITSQSANDLATTLSAMENFDAGDLTYEELSNLGTTPEQIAQNIKDSQFTKEQEKRAERITSQKIGDETPTLQGDDDTFTKGDKGTQVGGGIVYDDPVGIGYDDAPSDSGTSSSQQDTSVDDVGSEEDPGSYGASEGSMGGMGDFNTGGLAGKKKTKVKKMKRGGLASKK